MTGKEQDRVRMGVISPLFVINLLGVDMNSDLSNIDLVPSARYFQIGQLTAEGENLNYHKVFFNITNYNYYSTQCVISLAASIGVNQIHCLCINS